MEINFTKHSKVFTLLLAASLGLSACSQTSSTSDNQNKTSQVAEDDGLSENAPTYLVAMEAAYPPYAFRDDKGHVAGYDADVLKAIAKNQGFRIKILNRQWSGIFDTLTDGSRDIVGSGANYTEERAEKMDATNPISNIGELFFVSKGSDINSLEDLVGKKVATQVNTSMYDRLEELSKGKNITLQTYDSMYLALKSVVKGESDAVYGSSSVIRYFIKNMPESYYPKGFKELESGEPSNLTVFYVKKGNKTLLKKLNDGLAGIKSNGEYQKINSKWFGTTDTLQN